MATAMDKARGTLSSKTDTVRRRLNLEEASTGAWWDARSAPRGMVDDASLFHSLDDLLAVLGA